MDENNGPLSFRARLEVAKAVGVAAAEKETAEKLAGLIETYTRTRRLVEAWLLESAEQHSFKEKMFEMSQDTWDRFMSDEDFPRDQVNMLKDAEALPGIFKVYINLKTKEEMTDSDSDSE